MVHFSEVYEPLFDSICETTSVIIFERQLVYNIELPNRWRQPECINLFFFLRQECVAIRIF